MHASDNLLANKFWLIFSPDINSTTQLEEILAHRTYRDYKINPTTSVLAANLKQEWDKLGLQLELLNYDPFLLTGNICCRDIRG